MKFPLLRMPASPSSLRRLGVLGMNGRNTQLIMPANPRAYYPRVDDKLLTKTLCQQHGIPVPATYAVIEDYGAVRQLDEILAARGQLVIKPSRGAGGRGVMVVKSASKDGFQVSGQPTMTLADIRYHVLTSLAGFYSLGGHLDRVIIEQRIVCHPAFRLLSTDGTPDVRIILRRGIPVMAMVRLPTAASKGRANLHQGAIGAGVDLATGRTLAGVCANRRIAEHPDTGRPIAGHVIPHWHKALLIAMKLADVLELGYIGVDLVIDLEQGPVVLEANARPGLAIQIANGRGLLPRLAAVDALGPGPLSISQRLRLVGQLAAMDG